MNNIYNPLFAYLLSNNRTLGGIAKPSHTQCEIIAAEALIKMNVDISKQAKTPNKPIKK